VTAPAIAACLGLDQARRTGWGLSLPAERRVVESGVATSHEERLTVLEQARALAGGDMRRVFVLFEDHSGIPLTRLTRADRATRRQGRAGAPERSTASILGLGAQRGRWEELLDMLGHPPSLRDDVEPRTWRARVLGTVGGTADYLKAVAGGWASAHLDREVTDLDEAEGVCIAAFAAQDGLARLGQRRQAQRLYARDKRDARRQLELGAVGLEVAVRDGGRGR
jgi:hypothetical protein